MTNEYTTMRQQPTDNIPERLLDKKPDVDLSLTNLNTYNILHSQNNILDFQGV